MLPRTLAYSGVDREKVKRLDDLVEWCYTEFPNNYPLQDVFLNQGYELKKRPKSVGNIGTLVINRKIAQIHLAYLENTRKNATRPQLVKAEAPLVWTPDSEKDPFEIGISAEAPLIWTPDSEKDPFEIGISAESLGIEALQIEWMESDRLRAAVEEYEKCLRDTLYWFDKQTILTSIGNSVRIAHHSRKEAWSIIKKLRESYDGRAHGALDKGYYSEALRHFGAADRLAEKLREDEFGELFVLRMDELQKALLSKLW